MKTYRLIFGFNTSILPALALAGLLLATQPLLAAAGKLDTDKIEKVTGVKGTFNTNEGVFKITSPRNDVKISVDGWTMPPFMGLASWVAFTEQ